MISCLVQGIVLLIVLVFVSAVIIHAAITVLFGNDDEDPIKPVD